MNSPWLWVLAGLVLVLQQQGTMSAESDLGYGIGNKRCTAENTHGFLRTDLDPPVRNNFVRAVFVGQGVTKDRGQVVNVGQQVTIKFVLEVYHTRRQEWRRLGWDELTLHHAKKIHVVLLSADMDTFIHTHPLGNETDTVFSVHVPLERPQEYTMSIQFAFNTAPVYLCIDEHDAHDHDDGDSMFVAELELPVTAIDGDTSTFGEPTQLGRVYQTNVSLLQDADHAAVAFSNTPANQLACCSAAADSSTVSTPSASCITASMSISTTLKAEAAATDTPSTNVSLVTPGTVVPIPEDGCLIFNFELKWSHTQKPVQNLAMWLEAPAHILLARQSNDGVGRPNALVHFHALAQSVDDTGIAMLLEMCGGHDMDMFAPDPAYRFGPDLASVARGLVTPGSYGVYAAFKYSYSGDGETDVHSTGLFVPRFSFELGQSSTLAPPNSVCDVVSATTLATSSPQAKTFPSAGNEDGLVSFGGHDSKAAVIAVSVVIACLVLLGIVLLRRRHQHHANAVSKYALQSPLHSPLNIDSSSPSPLPSVQSQ
eukprot:m.165702 g.165702  ORF g.165702 m.165702 type:complete len:540 (+) comp31392_c1_seq4:42-1661(+)